jgi:hypothetical protein
MNGSGSNGNARLAALQKRAEELKTKLALEQSRLRRREEKDKLRLFRIVGEALVQHAAQHPDFDLTLKGILQTAVSGPEKNFLHGKGWL